MRLAGMRILAHCVGAILSGDGELALSLFYKSAHRKGSCDAIEVHRDCHVKWRLESGARHFRQ